MKSRLTWCFWLGWGAHLAATCLYQDVLGKACFIAQVRSHWLDTSPGLWAVVLVVLIALYIHQREKAEDET